eukprot:7249960-Karenia_brevis.AAC.1
MIIHASRDPVTQGATWQEMRGHKQTPAHPDTPDNNPNTPIKGTSEMVRTYGENDGDKRHNNNNNIQEDKNDDDNDN